jgi:hypothetical protein
MGNIIVVPKYHRIGEGFSKAEKLKALEHSGRQTNPKKGYQSGASWVGDLADLRKAILLCSWCKGRFNPRRNKYRRHYVPDPTGVTDGYQHNGTCDVCKCQTINNGGGTFYVAEEHWKDLSVDPGEARRMWRARMKANAQSLKERRKRWQGL